jgi:hypothetical protein
VPVSGREAIKAIEEIVKEVAELRGFRLRIPE